VLAVSSAGGQLGDGHTTNRDMPFQISVPGKVIAIGAGCEALSSMAVVTKTIDQQGATLDLTRTLTAVAHVAVKLPTARSTAQAIRRGAATLRRAPGL
jgi:hypothetical protein